MASSQVHHHQADGSANGGVGSVTVAKETDTVIDTNLLDYRPADYY
jgi:hypothetical protein